MKKNIYSLLKGKFLTSNGASQNWVMIFYLLTLAIVTIGSSHSADQKVHEIAKLNNEVKELRSIMIDGRGQLMKLKKESYLEKKMGEKGIAISEIPPHKIKVKSQKE
ncbi:FtsL-like putative cell division protein [Oceanihabitans sediminis]|uniref:S-adenosyl-methyltransferase n=1 Tax=Oceanihabitans sediminis TaxID=1812012 RepID=A0A368PBV6_9FLAO|nr:FtsL-like putative cell division protein [Oceanihabitans sediminis]MDX1278174.1 FtsL-like putative cell division protein [Oceanihabitans sediminis]MDX1773917.1 FtsL-like putative cell division protein [Oceanihabitans sediminis]RBP32057.1 hypothetical protein DFR65_10393 [Oceanihabitans sediminis]RCU58711.1 S-adenosyl-methyltransferase [Oceanihabitans sediminis]